MRNSARLVLFFLCCSLGSACAALPDVSKLGSYVVAPSRRPDIVGVQGALPDAKRQALLQQMAARTGPTDILDRHIAAEQAISAAPLIAGNKVTLLDDGPVTLRAMMQAMRSARDHIHLETYIIEDDDVGRALADLLIEKRAAGVQVNLIYDSVGTLGTPPEFFDRLRTAGVDLLEFNPVDPSKAQGRLEINRRDHRKLLVVDGRIAFTGSVNISRAYGKSAALPSWRKEPTSRDANEAAWRDTHMQIEGPAVADFQTLFIDAWQRKSGKPLSGGSYFPPLRAQGDALVRVIGSSAEKADYTIYKIYVSSLANASKYVHLTIAYFVPDRQLIAALKDAARRGVEVTIVFPSFTDPALILSANRSFYEELMDAGVKVYETNEALLHAKTAVIDGVWSTIGSANIDMRSSHSLCSVVRAIKVVNSAIRL